MGCALLFIFQIQFSANLRGRNRAIWSIYVIENLAALPYPVCHVMFTTTHTEIAWLSHVLWDAMSVTVATIHLTAVRDLKMATSSPEHSSPRKKKRLQKYRREWENEYQWLDCVTHNVYKPNCTVCHQVSSISHGGLCDIKLQHWEGIIAEDTGSAVKGSCLSDISRGW